LEFSPRCFWGGQEKVIIYGLTSNYHHYKVIDMSGWIGVDLDGTLAKYDRWVNTFHIGEPIGPMLERVKGWLAEGREVRIFTARIDGGGAASKMGVDPEITKYYEDVEAITKIVQDWTEKYLGVRLPVTNKKDYGMVELWDDRCVQVIPNTGIRADGRE
jgi:hypothetical protein